MQAYSYHEISTHNRIDINIGAKKTSGSSKICSWKSSNSSSEIGFLNAKHTIE
jgi:hypothetical protein